MAPSPIRLICLPFAGGTQYAFNPLKKLLPAAVILQGIDYPGHGTRMREGLLRDCNSLARDVAARILPYADAPYALFGHSLGALVAHLVAQQFAEAGTRLPSHLFLSGRNGPAWEDPRKEAIHLLPQADFLARLRAFGGTPEEVLQSDELLALLEPILRADFAAGDSYRYQPAQALDIPISVMGGYQEEDASPEALRLWQEISTLPMQLQMFEGGHFFILHHWQEIATLIRSRLGIPHLA